MYKKVLATGGIVSSLLFAGGVSVYAQSNQTPQTSLRHEMGKFNANKLAEKFGLDATELQAELDAGKKLPDILENHGVTRNKMARFAAKHKDHRLEKALDVLAPKFGLNADDIRAELAAGKSFDQILIDNGITKEQVKDALGNGMGRMRGPNMSPALFQIQADVLGMTTAELQAAREAKQSLKDILAAHNLTIDEFHTKVREAIEAAFAAGTMDENAAHFFHHRADRTAQ